MPGSISIAVLPFVNLSGDAGQEFFSDGMTEEITAALAQVPGLRVLGRTSAFEFKGQNKDLRTIGQALGATHLIEGSVRKAGNRVRITAQLVKVDDDSHLWAQNYDRELTDVFAIQENIAQAIAGALKVPLGLQQGDTLVRNQTKDLESYEQYLHAKALVRARGTANDEAIAVLEKVVARDSQFAPAWAFLAYAYALTPANIGSLNTGSIEEARRVVQTYLDKAEAGARKAIQLDSRHAGGYLALAYTKLIHGKWAAAEDNFKQALALDPNDPEALHEYSVMLAYVGRIQTSLSMREKLLTLEPFVPIFKMNTAIYLQFAGRDAASIQLLEPLPPNVAGGYGRNITLAHAYAKQGLYTKGADTLLLATNSTILGRSVEDAARLLRTAPTKTPAPESLPALGGGLSFVYAYVGALDRVMDNPERLLKIGYSLGGALWFPEYAPVRKTERYKAHMRNAGLVDYWRARGWPDLCRPMGADDFVCD